MKKLIFILLISLFSIICLTEVYGAEIRTKPGNIVHITVLGYPELSKAVLVRRDGSTDYPLLANVPIDGMTVHQLQETLQPILARFVERPKLFISIAEYIQLEVTIEGQVANPGAHTVKGPINLQGALSIAGGTTQLADLRNVKINRLDYTSRRETTVDLYHFFSDPGKFAIPEIEDGDIIFVPMLSSTSLVRVIGAVRNPGLFNPVKAENLADMINLAGGSLQNGNMNRILHITTREGTAETKIIKLKKLINDGLTDEIPLAYPGDVIVVSEYYWWQETRWWVNMIRDMAVVFSSILILSR